MSGDVQPRKRKDKRKKKDDLGVEEPRGTAAVFGEGDVFIHSHHDHGTGGHWCAKIIFFSLLAVLVTLVGLIILENRGLTELEANAVESRYSGVLEGWLEDIPDYDHHDEHTLELKHHDDDDDHDNDNGDDDHVNENDHDEDDEHNDDDEHDEDDHSDIDNDHNDNDEDDDNDEDQENEDSQEQDLDTADDEDENGKTIFSKYFRHDDDDDNDDQTNNDDDDDDDQRQSNEDNDDQTDNDDDDDDDQRQSNEENDDQTDNDDDDDDDQRQSNEDNEEADENNTEEDAVNNYDEDDDNLIKDRTDDAEADDKSLEDTNDNELNWEDNRARDDEDEDEQEEEQDDESDVEVERIEREVSEEEPVSTELPALPETDDSDDVENMPKVDPLEELDDEADEFLENDDEEPPVVEDVSAPAGQPFTEVEDVSTERPSDTLAEEEEYEKRQEELRREKEQASHMWLKLAVGGALLVATHAVVRRATAPRDVPTDEEHIRREETPSLSDRRMTLIPEEPSTPVLPKRPQQWSPAIIEEKENISFGTKSAPSTQQESDVEEEQDEEPLVEEAVQPTVHSKATADKELYSDEDEEDEVIVEEKKEMATSKPAIKKESAPEPEHEEDVPDDVELIDDEQLEEELDEEEEDISDVDDVELLTRLEAKYGRLPEPERPGRKHKDGGNNVEDEWPGEPSDAYWRQELDRAEQELRQGEWTRAADRAQAASLNGSSRARWIAAVALDRAAEAYRDNRLLTRAIAAYLRVLEMNERLSNDKLIEIANRTLDRIQFRGNYLAAEPVYRLLIRRFPDDVTFRNNLSVTFLMANRADLAGKVLEEILQRWPNDRVALAHYGFVLKTHYNRVAEAVDYFQKALEDDTGPATEPRFYYHLGDSLLLLGRYSEAHEVHKRAAAHGHFLSAAQRSLYNVPRLRSRPWWNIEDTPYVKLAQALEKSWRDILKEGEAARALYEQEKEGLRERGEWSQLDLFVRGREIPGRCAAAPVTCAAVRTEAAAAGCRRGQIKFSAMAEGTHVRPHVGPTNCRLRMHLGLANTTDTYIRVDREIRQWQVGKTFLFDDSFEHEVWHNGTGRRLVLIVDLWHPDLTPAERRALPPI